MGPAAIRSAQLTERILGLGHTVHDFGNLPGPDASTAPVGDLRLRYKPEILKICRRLSDRVARVVNQGFFPLILGGDQTVSIGTLSGLAQRGSNRGIIWMDAHGDFNTHETTPSGNIHGMALAGILGYGHPGLVRLGGITPKALEENTVLIGGRSFDEGESLLLRRSKVTVFTMREIDELGVQKVVKEAIRVASRGVKEVHLSFDMDALDPLEAPGTGTPVPGGLTYREAHLAMEMLYDHQVITSAEFVEVNPILDVRNQTGELTVQLILSLLGKQILKRVDGQHIRPRNRETRISHRRTRPLQV